MPFTPFHMGPGLFIKAVLQSSFSLMVFGWTQIIMDIQPLIVSLTGKGHLHGFTHTYLGATLIAVFSAVTGKYLSQFALALLLARDRQAVHIRWWIAILSGFIGSYSHVFLDSLIHSDLAPYFPFSPVNHFLGIISVADLYKLCVYSGILGAVLYFGVSYLIVRRNKHIY
ncbi:MAG: hypothetical protein HY081_11710 [Gammaproteobacteria bacterium]|nr:hypothetical protein [Gammaproteobacteria bacterium]